jgi:hypothetical protein
VHSQRPADMTSRRRMRSLAAWRTLNAAQETETHGPRARCGSQAVKEKKCPLKS